MSDGVPLPRKPCSCARATEDPAALSLRRPRPSQRQPRACRSPAQGAGGGRPAGLAAGRGSSFGIPLAAPRGAQFRMLSRQLRRTGARRSRGFGARRLVPHRHSPCRRRKHNEPKLVAGWEHEAEGRRNPGNGGTLGRGGVPAWLSASSLSCAREAAAAGWRERLPFPPTGRPCGSRTSCPAGAERGGCRGPGRAELNRGGVSGGRALRPVGEGAVFNPGLVGLRRQRPTTNPREGFEERRLSPTSSLEAVAGSGQRGLLRRPRASLRSASRLLPP